MKGIFRRSIVILLGCYGLISVSITHADLTSQIIIGMGDSIGQGVQSGDASWRTQPFSYLSWIGYRMESPLALPLIQDNAFGVVGNPAGRPRIDPGLAATNISVSGADVNTLLYERANALTAEQIDSETDLVLFPRTLSQMEIAESAGADWIICWVGNNDVLSAITAFDQLDATQMTSVASFETDFISIADRLAASHDAYGTNIIFGNIPDVTSIAFLLDGQDLIRFLGNDFGLPEGSYVSYVAMWLIKLGLDDGRLVQDPNFVLDATEVATINSRVAEFNTIIAQEANRIGMPVVDINTLFAEVSATPPEYYGIPLTSRYLNGFFSLDGIHPSHIGHAMLANAYIDTMNSYFGTSVPPINDAMLEYLFLNDPFNDKDRDNIATGQPFAGLLETLALFLGISGDSNDYFYDGPLPGSAAMAPLSIAKSADSATEETIAKEIAARRAELIAQLHLIYNRDGRW